jgi:hypothetical protein
VLLLIRQGGRPGPSGFLQPASTWPQPEADETSLALAKGLTVTLTQPHSTHALFLSIVKLVNPLFMMQNCTACAI